MSDRKDDVRIKVGFEGHIKEIEVTLPKGDILPYQPGDKLAIVGKPLDRVDAVAKVTGKAKYSYDRHPKGMIYGRILRSPHANARIKSVDLSGALAMKGVHAAISFPDEMGSSEVRFAGQEVAAVAAETEALAEEALNRIQVDYEVRPFAVTKEAAMEKGAPEVVPGRANVVTSGRRRRESAEEFEKRLQDQKEKVDEALKDCAVTVHRTFETQVQVHCSLEPHGSVMQWDGDHLICYASTQATFNCRREAQSSRGAIRAGSAEVTTEYMGGGFGSKFGLGREGAAGAILAKKAGRPVRLMLERRGEQTAVGNRPDSKQEMTLGVTKDGKFKALRAYSWGTAGPSPFGAGARNHVFYGFENIDKVEHMVRTNCGQARAMRAPAWPQGVFAMESIIDEAAAKLGMDPVEIRKKNDTHPIRIHEYDMGAERIGWKKRRNKKPGAGRGPVKRGLGCASTEWFASGGGGSACLVRIHKDGTVEVRNGAQDIGTGTRTVMGMVVAEELGLPLEKVQTFIGHTTDPLGPGSGGSTTIGSLSPAARLAGYRAKEELLQIVAERHGWKVEDLDLKGGRVVSKKGKRLDPDLSFSQACAMIQEGAVEVTARRPIVSRRRPNYQGFAPTNSGVQFAEVEVDTETGNVKVTRLVAVQDCGKVINAKTAESQVRGGVIQGVSYALLERRIMDRHKGQMLNADMEMYKIAGPADIPQIDVVLVDVYNGQSNTGVMGLGEPPKVATAAAISNAVFNAIGVHITSLPITPKKVLEALARKEEK
ncbi:MAG TPA: xanthine dehydrogenase family protein molybdopterin-binding subunit [Planctomycetes bacterium]|nr:xanthine dehydrogenase family protein molybdopterin-binding subunit [Planctomycetota bacterium]